MNAKYLFSEPTQGQAPLIARKTACGDRPF